MSTFVSDHQFVSADVINGRQTASSFRHDLASDAGFSGRPASPFSMLDPSIFDLAVCRPLRNEMPGCGHEMDTHLRVLRIYVLVCPKGPRKRRRICSNGHAALTALLDGDDSGLCLVRACVL
jgi:hypothetical protein